jgi:Lysyl oxidase
VRLGPRLAGSIALAAPQVFRVRRLLLLFAWSGGFLQGPWSSAPYTGPANPAGRPPRALTGITARIIPGNDVGRLLLPDLRTLAPSGFLIERRAGGRVLRLGNTVWNSGQGPLELVGEIPRTTQVTSVRQVVYTSDGILRDRFVGDFIWHASHGHWHIEEFARYELWSLGPSLELDRVVAGSTKVSYCLIDTRSVSLDIPGAPSGTIYRGCGRVRQGLSVGWGDEYKAHLDGQTIDLGELPDGIYALVSTVNPGGRLAEANYANNSSVVYLDLAGTRVDLVPASVLNRERCLTMNAC